MHRLLIVFDALSFSGLLIHVYFFFSDCIFPVLDILRLAVRNEDINTRLSSDKYIFGYLKDNLQEDSPVANQMLSLRTLCNLLIHKAGEQLVLDHKDFITETLGHFSGLSNKSLQVRDAFCKWSWLSSVDKDNFLCGSFRLITKICIQFSKKVIIQHFLFFLISDCCGDSNVEYGYCVLQVQRYREPVSDAA